MTTTRLPSLNALRAFDAVARLGSVSLAGSELSVTSGAVSRHIKELENDLGVAILEREGRGVRLTIDGKRLRNSLKPAFEMISKAVMRTRRDPRRKKLLVLVEPVFATKWLIPRLDRFSRQAPKVDIVVADKLAESDTSEAGADIVIKWGTFDSTDDVVVERLTQEEVVPVCSPAACPENGLAGAALLHRHSFQNSYNSYAFPDWPTFLAAVGREGIDGGGPHSGPSFSGGLIIDAAREGMGVALATATIVRDELAEGHLVRPVVDTMEIDNGYWLLASREVSDRAEVKVFRTWLQKELAVSVDRPAGAMTSNGTEHSEDWSEIAVAT